MLACAAIAALGSAGTAICQDPWQAERGVLPRGTSYEMRKPNNWNGTLISDLDFASRPDGPTYTWLLDHGYALSGTARRDDRVTDYDPAHEIIDLINVMDRFEAKFGKPVRTIQYGQSGGGHVSLGFAENHPDRVDGVVALCAHTPYWFITSALDAWFVLKLLIAPDLRIVDVPRDSASLSAAWRRALTDAQQTPLGRARIALATTIGQLPAWTSKTNPEPDPSDVNALQRSMFESLLAMDSPMSGASQVGGASRFMLEQAGSGQLSSNVDVDYALFFANGERAYKTATQKLYEAAGVDLEDELARVNAGDRIEADPKAIKWWSSPGRAVMGKPKVPVMRIHTHADEITPATQVEGYDAAVKANGYESFYRTAFVRSAGHCNFNVAERLTAVETLIHRLDNGVWRATSPDSMNELASKHGPTTEARFFDYEQPTYNRAWFPAPADYLGRHGAESETAQR